MSLTNKRRRELERELEVLQEVLAWLEYVGEMPSHWKASKPVRNSDGTFDQTWLIEEAHRRASSDP